MSLDARTPMYMVWVILAFVVASGAVVGYAAYRYKQILSVTGFFIKAATVYVLVGEDDARLAAVAAGKGAIARDRQRMKTFLQTLSNSFHGQNDKRWQRHIERVANLVKELDSGGTMSAEAFQARELLRLRNDVYLRALRAGDPGVFLRRYPQLFGHEAEKAMSAGEHPDHTTEEIVADTAAETAPSRATGGAGRKTPG